jgi:hypothetical protein
VIGQMFFLNREIDRKDALVTKALQTVLGRVSPSYLASLRASPVKMKAAVNKKFEEFQNQAKGGSASASLDLINELSKSVPKSTTLEIKQLDLSGNKLTLSVDSPSQADADKAVIALTTFPWFQSPKAGPIESKGTRKKFSLTTTFTRKGGA